MDPLVSILVIALICGLVAYCARFLPAEARPFLHAGAGIVFVAYLVFLLAGRLPLAR